MILAKLVDVDGSVAMLLPEEARARLHAKAGDIVHLVEEKDGFLLTPHGEEALQQLRKAREAMSQRIEILRALAKE